MTILELAEFVVQIAIVLSSAAAILLLSLEGPINRWGYIVGLVGQPCWLVSNAVHGQWGMFVVSLFFTYAYANGIWNFWIKPWRRS